MRDLVTGFRLFGRGLGMLLRSPRLLLIGALPAVLTRLLLLGGMITLVSWSDDMATLGLRDGVLLVLRSLMVTVLLLLAGFLPVVGQTVVPVLLTLVTAWLLALELVAVPSPGAGGTSSNSGNC